MRDKKGVLGLDTVKSVMLIFLILTVIAVALVITLSSIRDVAEDIDLNTITVTNLTTSTVVNYSGAYPTGIDETFRNCVLTITAAYNETHITAPITAANYTTDGCKVLIAPAAEAEGAYNNSAWNITGSYTYSNPRTRLLGENVSQATTGFFSNTGTIFAILVVVVIILAISIIIGVVSRFGGAGSMRGGREYGSDTVMGI